jgi:hypothetical protein
MTRIQLNWKKPKPKPTGPVYIAEAAELLGTTQEALRIRVHRMMNRDAKDSLPQPYMEPWKGHGRWAWERAKFTAYLKMKAKLDDIVRGGKA